MFDISFAELLLIAVITMIVIGPQRLPETFRFLGLWAGRLKRSLARARRELEREVGMDDIRRQLHNEEVLRNLEEYEKETGDKQRYEETPPTSPDEASSPSDENRPG
jgi:sec-independent protein translocase protein TatB